MGTGLWNPSYWISGAFDWSKFSKTITGQGGPLSEQGPLGSHGPLAPGPYNSLASMNDFASHLRGGGVWAVLGPLGPLGPVRWILCVRVGCVSHVSLQLGLLG